MALLKFNGNFLTLTVEAGAEEEYTPTMEVKSLIEKINGLREKVKAEQDRQKEEYQAFLKAKKITEQIADIAKEVDAINKETYPEIEQLKDGKIPAAQPVK